MVIQELSENECCFDPSCNRKQKFGFFFFLIKKPWICDTSSVAQKSVFSSNGKCHFAKDTLQQHRAVACGLKVLTSVSPKYTLFCFLCVCQVE